MNPSIQIFNTPIVWHVCFHRGRALWGRRWTHVSLAGCAEDTWVFLDWNRSGLSVGTVYRFDDVQDFWAFINDQMDVVRFGTARPGGYGYMRPLTCVGFVKHALGVRSGALRPEALFKTLVTKYHGVHINESPQAAEDAGTDRR